MLWNTIFMFVGHLNILAFFVGGSFYLNLINFFCQVGCLFLNALQVFIYSEYEFFYIYIHTYILQTSFLNLCIALLLFIVPFDKQFLISVKLNR